LIDGKGWPEAHVIISITWCQREKFVIFRDPPVFRTVGWHGAIPPEVRGSRQIWRKIAELAAKIGNYVKTGKEGERRCFIIYGE